MHPPNALRAAKSVFEVPSMKLWERKLFGNCLMEKNSLCGLSQHDSTCQFCSFGPDRLEVTETYNYALFRNILRRILKHLGSYFTVIIYPVFSFIKSHTDSVCN